MNLFLCKTPIQVLRAIQLTYYNVDGFGHSSICIFDTFDISKKIVSQLKDTDVFQEVYYVKNNDFKKGKCNYLRSFFEKNFLSNIVSNNSISSISIFNVDTYDSFAIYNQLKRKVRVYYIEDAPMIYSFKTPSKRNQFFYGIFGLKFPIFYVDGWYFSAPDLMKTINDAPVHRLPYFNKNDKEFLDLVNAVFEYAEEPVLNQAKVIFMEESLYTDGILKNSADFYLYREIYHRYSDTNFAVKLHPRTRENRFKNELDVLEKSSIPWEVYLLNSQMNNKIFISMACSTMISPKLLFSEEYRSILVYKLLDKDAIRTDGSPYFDKEWINALEKLPKLYNDKEKVLVPESKEKLFDILDKWIKE